MAARALEDTKSLARSDSVCAAILKEFNKSLHTSFHARLVPILKSIKHHHAKILAMRQFVEQTMLGDPLEDRLSIVKAIKEGEKATSVFEIPILADNLTFLRLILEAHHELCTRLRLECEAPISDIDLGKIFFQKIDWTVGILSPLNSWLYGCFTLDFTPWCRLQRTGAASTLRCQPLSKQFPPI